MMGRFKTYPPENKRLEAEYAASILDKEISSNGIPNLYGHFYASSVSVFEAIVTFQNFQLVIYGCLIAACEK